MGLTAFYFMTTLERINDEGDKYGFQVPYDGTSEFYDRSAVKAYIAGAKSERNKTIEEVLSTLDPLYKDYIWYKYLRAKIEALKL